MWEDRDLIIVTPFLRTKMNYTVIYGSENGEYHQYNTFSKTV